MNEGSFTGRVAKSPTFRDAAKTPVCYFKLILNEYAVKDEESHDFERKVAIPFTAFGKKAQVFAEHALVGDQLIVFYHLADYDREQNSQMEYGFSFIVDEFDFGAPGEAKHEKLNKPNG